MLYVVDPNESDRESICALAGRLGYRTVALGSAESLLSCEQVGEPDDCVITEMDLPGISGLELVRTLRDRKIAAPVIILTRNPDVSSAVEALREKIPAYAYMTKPFVERKLASCLKSLVDGRDNKAASRD
jgi:FixJ family two-component response regulator